MILRIGEKVVFLLFIFAICNYILYEKDFDDFGADVCSCGDT